MVLLIFQKRCRMVPDCAKITRGFLFHWSSWNHRAPVTPMCNTEPFFTATVLTVDPFLQKCTCCKHCAGGVLWPGARPGSSADGHKLWTLHLLSLLRELTEAFCCTSSWSSAMLLWAFVFLAVCCLFRCLLLCVFSCSPEFSSYVFPSTTWQGTQWHHQTLEEPTLELRFYTATSYTSSACT